MGIRNIGLTGVLLAGLVGSPDVSHARHYDNYHQSNFRQGVYNPTPYFDSRARNYNGESFRNDDPNLYRRDEPSKIPNLKDSVGTLSVLTFLILSGLLFFAKRNPESFRSQGNRRR